MTVPPAAQTAITEVQAEASKKIPSCRIALRQVASNDTSPSAAVQSCPVIGNSNSISYYNIKKNSIHTWQIHVLRASLKKTPAFIYFESSSFYISAKQTFHLPAASPYRKGSCSAPIALLQLPFGTFIVIFKKMLRKSWLSVCSS